MNTHDNKDILNSDILNCVEKEVWRVKNHIKSWIEAFFEASLIFLLLFFVFFPAKVEGPSMENTLYNGDRIIVSRILAYIDFYERGDIIVFNHNVNGKNIKMVKRIIAVEGDKVEIKFGNIYVNGQILHEEYANGIPEDELEILVGDGQIFVMGDNRSESVDSRDYGTVDEGEVSAKVIMRFFPLDSIKFY